ncbi:transthyretin-like family domain-containing protein [Ditylenchus destructor]|uniref:Transthyretin-like family domain-containing protein n=1 Tax=Ditylenchus destructor TaxID=166010 RepID=A0AAD4QUG2_9BILA|nr:transthyretin-like family domain-containing protein [Ditylenchus destructor]
MFIWTTSVTLFALFHYTMAGSQNIHIVGMVFCHDNEGNAFTSQGEKVSLWEKDWESGDDKLSSTTTGANGSFLLTGSHSEFLAIQPYVVVFAKCEQQEVHLMTSPLGKRCHFEVEQRLTHKGDESIHGISIVVDVTTAKINCS